MLFIEVILMVQHLEEDMIYIWQINVNQIVIVIVIKALIIQGTQMY